MLDMLLQYPESLKKFTFTVIPTLRSLHIHYMEYLDEIPHDDPEERLFFDPNWIPIAMDLEGFYVDPTNPKYPVFGTLRDDHPPFVWKKVILIDSLSELITLMPDRQAVKDLFISHAVSCMDFLHKMRQKRIDLIFQGKSPAKEVDWRDIFPAKGKMPDSVCINEFQKITITNIYPAVIGLLDHNSTITDLQLKWVDMPVLEEDLVKLTCIRNLVTYICFFDPGLVESLSFRIDGLVNKVNYRNYTLDIVFANNKKTLAFIEAYENLRSL
jgi:hypothetical protein